MELYLNISNRILDKLDVYTVFVLRPVIWKYATASKIIQLKRWTETPIFFGEF